MPLSGDENSQVRRGENAAPEGWVVHRGTLPGSGVPLRCPLHQCLRRVVGCEGADQHLERLGQDPDVVIPTDPDDPTKILDGFKAHAWRRWWATKLERLGYGKKTSKDDFDLDRHVNFMGSWTILGGGIREERYVQLDPHVLCAIANFEDGTRFLAERARFEQQKTSDLIARVTGASPAALTIKEESA